jgi:hypothetical protein
MMRLVDTPMLTVIPYIETPAETRMRIVKNVALGGLVALSLITVAYVVV